jgi:hypothetical protein
MTYNINIDGVNRPMTEDEIKDYEATRAAMLKDAKATQAEQQAKATAKQAVLDKLGLTADEVAALLS